MKGYILQPGQSNSFLLIEVFTTIVQTKVIH